MFIDAQGQFADETGSFAPTSVGTTAAPNVLDTAPLGGSPTANGGLNVGEGEDLYVVITVLTAAAGGGTLTFQLITSASSSLSSPTVLDQSQPFSASGLTAGTQIKIKFPNSAAYKEFLGVQALIATTAFTGGAYSAQIMKDVSSNTQYAGNFSVS
jgi:hypothetical protein